MNQIYQFNFNMKIGNDNLSDKLLILNEKLKEKERNEVLIAIMDVIFLSESELCNYTLFEINKAYKTKLKEV